jgi:epimerase transport system membrane fusion protein
VKLPGFLSPDAITHKEVAEPAPDDSLRGTAVIGWAIVGLFFGVFGLWSVLAPLNGAVVGQGVVKTEGNRKSVQHLDGGIVKEMRVKEGDNVRAGEVLVVLDETQARAEFDILTQMFLVTRATGSVCARSMRKPTRSSCRRT